MVDEDYISDGMSFPAYVFCLCLIGGAGIVVLTWMGVL